MYLTFACFRTVPVERKKLIIPERDDHTSVVFHKVTGEGTPRAPVKGLAFGRKKWLFILFDPWEH